MTRKKSDVLVLGAGPSGLSTAISCKINNPDMSVRVIERSQPYNKIGCVIRDETLDFMERLNVDPKEIGAAFQMDSQSLLSIKRCKFETALVNKAKALGVDLTYDTICNVNALDKDINSVRTVLNGEFSADHFVDATGQVALIPRSLGLRKPSGTAFKALYTHFLSDVKLDIVRNKVVENGFVWIIPLPYSPNDGKLRYQLIKILKETSETITHVNLYKSIPFLKDMGINDDIRFLDPCNKFSEYVRQYPPFIYENEMSKGSNWTSVGDSDSTFYDRIFSGIDKALMDGIKTGESLSTL